MYDDTPVIKAFIHNDKYYLYDFGKNNILQLSEGIFKEIKDLQKLGVAEYISKNKSNQFYPDVITLLNRGYFKDVTVENISHYCTPYLDLLLNRFLQDLILQVTQDCNFQCRYYYQVLLQAHLINQRIRILQVLCYKLKAHSHHAPLY